MTSETQEIVHVADEFTLPPVEKAIEKLQAIQALQAVVKEHMIEGHDYGKIAGFGDKPTLFKPGAEKICAIMGLAPSYEIRRLEEPDMPYFEYEVICTLTEISSGRMIAQGVGNCNTREKRFSNQDPFSVKNNVLKQAKIRAHRDASLTPGSLSGIFTQDLEDMRANGIEGNSQAPRQTRPASGNATSIICPSGEKIGLKRDGTPFDMCYKCSQMSAADRPGACASNPSAPREADESRSSEYPDPNRMTYKPPEGYDDSAFEAMEMME